MSPKHVLLDQQDHVLTITLNRPERLNALINDMLIELRAAVIEGDSDPETRAIVITGSGRGFSAGADLNAFKEAMEESKRLGRVTESINPALLDNFAVRLAETSTPIIAAVNGPAIGFGLTLSIACDIRIASEAATFGAVFVKLGLTPEFGSTYNLVRLVGMGKATEMVFTARIIGAAEAKEMGLVNQVVPPEELMPTAMEMARTIAGFPPIAMGHAKRNLRSGMDSDLATQTHLEVMAQKLCRTTQDYEEGVNAFLGKRQPVFTGR